jgi:hypothetical protein
MAGESAHCIQHVGCNNRRALRRISMVMRDARKVQFAGLLHPTNLKGNHENSAKVLS